MATNPYPESCDRLPPILFGSLPEVPSEIFEARIRTTRNSLYAELPAMRNPSALALELDETEHADAYTAALRAMRRRLRAANRAGHTTVEAAEVQVTDT